MKKKFENKIIEGIRNHPYLVKYVELIVSCTVLNLLGSLVNNYLPFQLHLDTVGTMLSAIIGGYMPSVIVVMATSVIKEIFIYQEMYYAILSMVTAILTATLGRHLLVKDKIVNKAKVFLLIPVLALVNGYGFFIMDMALRENEIIEKTNIMVNWIMSNMHLSKDSALIVSSIAIEFIDKFISLVLAMSIFRLIPEKTLENYRHTGVWQNKLQYDVEVSKIKSKHLSVGKRLAIISNGTTLLVAVFAFIIGVSMYQHNVVNTYSRSAKGITEYLSQHIDPEMIDTYIEEGKSAEGYKEIEDMMYQLRECNPELEFFYIYQIREEGCCTVFDLDTEEVKAGLPGEIIPFDESFSNEISDLLAGRPINPKISNDTYGYLLTIYQPVYDSTGVCKCYICLDYSMGELDKYWHVFLIKFIFMLGAIMILGIVVSQWIINRRITFPINTLSYLTNSFAYNDEKIREENVRILQDLKIRTSDEIENLYLALTKTVRESTEYVTDIQRKSKEIEKMQKGLIMSLAELVESRDQSTGDHIKKTSAYVEIITEQMKRKGYYENQMTEEFCQNVIDAAPLHDIGKIHVPDSILTKPGKLTDDEFKIMKSHAAVGGQILAKVMKLVKSGYLKEARRMAEYHHEKWNGTGYPHGVAEEDIPLSARIMAVADVFDALVSKRCYKQGMPFDKAIGIIKEDAGKHFDPYVADAFLSSEEKVKEVLKNFNE